MVNLGDPTDDFTGTCKCKVQLATTPTEEDWFDITGTTLTTRTTTLSPTGNFVWVRAKATTNSDGNRSMMHPS